MGKYERNENMNLGSLVRRVHLKGQPSTQGKLRHRLVGDCKELKEDIK